MFRQGEQCLLAQGLLENRGPALLCYTLPGDLPTTTTTKKEQSQAATELLLLRLQGTGGVALPPLLPLPLVSSAHKLTASRLGSGVSSFASHVTRPAATFAWCRRRKVTAAGSPEIRRGLHLVEPGAKVVVVVAMVVVAG